LGGHQIAEELALAVMTGAGAGLSFPESPRSLDGLGEIDGSFRQRHHRIPVFLARRPEIRGNFSFYDFASIVAVDLE